ncbi:hypothetical protein [Fimbriiglobus ruber]|uniref:hypothetical protein n=1 Tax=Fimbriiglobus ruber TaxID=1908690 RepID=UPI000B4B8935|nr:hypothetical protein [Fimbriiglobus ruber]
MSSLKDFIQDLSNRPGAAPLHAAWRGGLKDFQDAVIPAFPDSMKAREEPGSIASPTSQLVTESMTGKNVDLAHDAITAPSKDHEMER